MAARYAVGRGRRGVRWLRIGLAVVGIGLQLPAIGRHPAPVWALLSHDTGLPLLLVAITLALWLRRRTSRSRSEIFRERLEVRPLMWRAGAGLLLLASGGLLVHRLFALGGLTGASYASAVFGFACLALTPIALIAGAAGERIVGGRSEKSLDLIRALTGRRVSRRELAAGSDIGFDPNAGAAGRPKPLYESLGGAPSRRPQTIRVRQMFGSACTLSWTGTELLLTQKQWNQMYVVPLVDQTGAGADNRSHLPGVAVEMVWFEFKPVRAATDPRYISDLHRRCLFLTDARGVAIAALTDITCEWSDLKELAQRAGLPFRAYRLAFPARNAREIQQLMFPRHRKCVTIA